MTDIAAIAARCERATDGPWRSRMSIHGKRYRYVEIDKADEYSTCELKPSDADFIAHAREDVPALLAVIATLQGVLTKLDTLLDFGEEIIAGEEMTFVDATAINEAFAEALSALSALSHGEGGGNG